MKMMKSSESLIKQIKIFEGLRTKAYKPVPTEKNFTIGYGHCSPSIKSNQIITEYQAELLLRDDLLQCEHYVNTISTLFTQGQFDALVDFVFNLGIDNLRKSTLLKKVRTNAPILEIQTEFRKWNKAGGKILPGLVKRREWEAKIYFEQ